MKQFRHVMLILSIIGLFVAVFEALTNAEALKLSIDLRTLAYIFSHFYGVGIIIAFFGVLALTGLEIVHRSLGPTYERPTPSENESLSAAERQVATAGDVLAREFEQRMKREVDSAVERLTSTADSLITSELAARIDAKIGENLVDVLGQKLSEQTVALSQMAALRREATDRFVQMRTRALQYADAAERQSQSFRSIGVRLALLGLSAIGLILTATFIEYWRNPQLSEQHVGWQVLILRNGPTYSFVVLCEFLALIMFRYQSKALEYMRYFSNEATNLDARHIAFVSALQFMDKAKIAKLIEKLEATERNFLISKDQRTLEMANNELEDRLLDRIKSFIDKRGVTSRPSPHGTSE